MASAYSYDISAVDTNRRALTTFRPHSRAARGTGHISFGQKRVETSPITVEEPAAEKLPISVRAVVILGGALLGWAVPIACALSFMR